MKGLEPSTFCMASRRSSQLSYIRTKRSSIAPPSTAARFNGGVGTGRSIAAMAKAAAQNKAVRGVAVSAGAAAAKRIGPIAQQRYVQWRDRRVYRDRAIKLARQLGGRYSEDTIIDGEPYFVVWKDHKPVEAFPHVDDVATRPELAGFDQALTRAPQELRRKRPE
jgi:hypothetical protein